MKKIILVAALAAGFAAGAETHVGIIFTPMLSSWAMYFG